MKCKKFFYKIYLTLSVLFLTILCGFIVGKIHSTDLENHNKENLLLEANTFSQIISPHIAKKAYYDDSSYRLIFEQIKTFIERNSFIDHIHTFIFTEQGFKLGPSTYREGISVPEEALKVLDEKKTVFDKSKTAVTAYIPVFDIETAKILMIMAFEVNREKWEENVNSNFIKYFIITVLCIIFLTVIIIFLAKFFTIFKDFSVFQIKFREFLPLIIGISLGIIIWGFYNYFYEVERLQWDLKLLKKNILVQWNDYIKEQVNILKKEAEKIINDNEVINAFLDRNRSDLNEKIKPIFRQLKSKYSITHLIFVEPDGKVFFRAHLPEKYGDKRITPLLTEAIYTGKDSWGIETGTKGGVLLSYTRALKGREGYIVVGIQIFDLSKNFFRENDSEIITIAYKNSIEREIFEEGKENYGYTGNWDDYQEIVILNQTIRQIPFRIKKILSEGSFYEKKPIYFKEYDSFYGCEAISILSKNGQLIGQLLVMKDLSFLWFVVNNKNFLNFVFVVTLCCGNLFLLLFLKDHANRRLDETFKTLKQKEKELEEEMVRSKELAIQAKSADFAKSQFLLSMSHEIRTPLNAIIGLTGLLSQTPLNFQQRDYLKRINNASEALIEIINNILDLSKIEAGKFELEEKEFNLDELIEKIVSIFVPKVSEKDIKFNLYIDSDVPSRLIGDSLRLKQIIMNLLWNALKFTESGIIELSIKVQEWINHNKVKLCFSVRDTGIGIPEDKMKEIFEPFTQIKYKEKGTGLGLALCKRLVELMKGEITVDSELGKGSIFKFTAVFGFVFTEKYIFSVLQGKTALCVDDNPDLLQILNKELDSIGVSVILEKSGKEALKMIENKSFDILIVDFTTDDLTGKEIIEYIDKNQDINPKPCMIIFVPYKNLSIIDKVVIRQKAKILIKPFVRSLLQNALLECMGIYKKEEKITEDISFKKGKILVVEDDEISQIVIREILKSMGLTVETADNGKRAIEMLKQDNFDAILMDIQMPEMDGIETTKLIREELELKTIPIIGLSAHAFKEEKQKALDAGMNDYLTKPMNREEIYKTLSKWFKAEKANLISLHSIIDMKTALSRLSGKEELYLKILKKFYSEYGEKLEFIEDLLAKKDYKEASMIFHKIKAAASTIGAMKLSELSKELEEAFLREEFDIVLFNEFKEEFKKIISAIAFFK